MSNIGNIFGFSCKKKFTLSIFGTNNVLLNLIFSNLFESCGRNVRSQKLLRNVGNKVRTGTYWNDITH